MDIIFAVCGFYLLFNLFYFGGKISTSSPTSKKQKLISGITGLISIIICIILQADILPFRNNKVILPIFNISFSDSVIAIITILGILESILLIIFAFTGGKKGTVNSAKLSSINYNIEKDKEIDDSIITEVNGKDEIEENPVIKNESVEDNKFENKIMVTCEGVRLMSDAVVQIFCDNEIKNKGSLREGFITEIKTNPGKHIIEAKFLSKSKKDTVDVEKGYDYEVTFSYSKAWGKYEMDILPLKKKTDVVDNKAIEGDPISSSIKIDTETKDAIKKMFMDEAYGFVSEKFKISLKDAKKIVKEIKSENE
jgi:hypothetical protein